MKTKYDFKIDIDYFSKCVNKKIKTTYKDFIGESPRLPTPK